jgi:hypothetical protein
LLFLFQWNYETKTIWAYSNGGWKEVKESSSHHLSKSIEIYGKKIEKYKKRIEINGEIFETDDYKIIL